MRTTRRRFTFKTTAIPAVFIMGAVALLLATPALGSTYYADKGITSVDPLYINTGNVGVGVAVPNEKLQVSGNVRATQFCLGATGNCLGSWPTAGGLTGTGTVNRLVKWIGTSALGDSQLTDDGTNVGIGTTSPSYKLDVRSWIRSTRGIDLTGGNLDPGQPGGTDYLNSDGAQLGQNQSGGGAELDFISPANDASSTAFAFLKKSGSAAPYSLSTLAVIQRNGNVGIGTTNPAFTLDVNGAVGLNNSDVYFTNTTHNHTGIGNTAGYAAIENASNYNTLMILGRSGGIGGGRSVSVWDRLDVNGNSLVTGSLGVGNLTIGSGGSPEYKLEVSGDTWISGWTGVGSNLSVSGRIYAYNGIQLGGVSRTTWPSPTLATYRQACTIYATGWQACLCPSGYNATGLFGYGCQTVAPYGCPRTYYYSSNGMQAWVDNSGGSAVIGAFCAKVNP